MKYEWRKTEKDIYGVKEQPAVVIVPEQKFITIDGKGNPNCEDFAQRVGVLYSLAYQVKMLYKSLYRKEPENYGKWEFDDYTVFPLEGKWTSTSPDPREKDCFIYTIMIKQPDVISRDIFEAALAAVQKKKPHPLLKEAVFQSMEDGKCIQILHKGSFDDEPRSFAEMDSFARSNGLERLDHYHREIYLSDTRRTAPEKRKTILRYQVK